MKTDEKRKKLILEIDCLYFFKSIVEKAAENAKVKLSSDDIYKYCTECAKRIEPLKRFKIKLNVNVEELYNSLPMPKI